LLSQNLVARKRLCVWPPEGAKDVRALLYRYFSGEDKVFEYKQFGLLLRSDAFKEFTE
jgi:hypothetical protein